MQQRDSLRRIAWAVVAAVLLSLAEIACKARVVVVAQMFLDAGQRANKKASPRLARDIERR